MSANGNHADSRKRLLLAALNEAKGIISTACASASIPRRTFYNWLTTDQEFRDAYEDIIEGSLDFVESKLLEKIEAGSEKAIFFYLKTRGRSRGYRYIGETASDLLNDEPLALCQRPQRYLGRPSRFSNPET